MQPPPLSRSKTLLLLQNKTLYLLQLITLPLPLPQPLVTTNLFPWVYLFCIFPTNEIIQYVTLCVWLLSLSTMFSRLIHVVARISILFLFIPECRTFILLVANEHWRFPFSMILSTFLLLHARVVHILAPDLVFHQMPFMCSSKPPGVKG